MPRLSAKNKLLLQTATRDSAYHCACELMLEEGWRSFTMEKLAARMGVSKGTIYNYFKDKQDVILFIQKRQIENSVREMEQRLAEESDMHVLLKEFVIEMLKGMKRFRFLHFAVGELLFKERNDSVLLFLNQDPMKPAREILSRILARGMEQGCVKRGDPDLMAAILHSAIAGVDMGSHFNNGLDTSCPEILEVISRQILQGICTEEK